jgi:ArsR family transcriptional regulator
MGFQDTFKALSDPTRRAILNILKDGAKTAGEIGSRFDMTGATISHHLAVLRGAGLIGDDRRGKYIYYELNMSVLDELVGWVAALKGEAKQDE